MKKAIPASKAIEAFCYLAWFSVETLHGNQLEFVLDKADERAGEISRFRLQPQGRVRTSYTEKLWEMLKKEFKRTKGVAVPESQEYGNLTFLVEAQTPAELQRALARCEKVSQRWINKYRVNQMLNAD